MDKRRSNAIIRHWEKGEDAIQVAKVLGLSSSTVYKVLYRNGIRPSQATGRPKKDHRRKHTMEQEAEIVRRYEAGEPLQQLAREFGCIPVTIRNVVIRRGGTVRPVGGPRRQWSETDIEDMVRRYQSGQSQFTIAEALGTSQIHISRILRKHGGVDGRRVVLRKGGRTLSNGYVHALVRPDDPLAEMRNSQGYVPEHRLVLARSLGRPLTEQETVHHINGDKTDNRLENLQLRKGNHGKHAAFQCQDCGSYDVASVSLH